MPSNDDIRIPQQEVIARLRAKGLPVTNQTIWKLRKRGAFPEPFKMGGLAGRNYYYVKDIEAFERGEWKAKA